jgi:transcriptional regulator with XRE-family HTH domain
MEQPRQPLNVVGTAVRRLREARGLTQEQLAAKCQAKGLDITRGTLAKIESRVRAVYDDELHILATILRSSADELFPSQLAVIRRFPKNPKGTRRPKSKSKASEPKKRE